MSGLSRDVSQLSLVLVLSAVILKTVAAKEFTLTILHTNDVHARIDEFDEKGSRCNLDETQNQCYGGIARQKFMVWFIQFYNARFFSMLTIKNIVEN